MRQPRCWRSVTVACWRPTSGSWSDEDALAVRRTFRGFGCCGVTEPYEDLVELGLIA